MIGTETGVSVIDLLPRDELAIRQCAALLVEGFREHLYRSETYSNWPQGKFVSTMAGYDS